MQQLRLLGGGTANLLYTNNLSDAFSFDRRTAPRRPHGPNGHNNKRRRERAADNREEHNTKRECTEEVNETVINNHLKDKSYIYEQKLLTDRLLPTILALRSGGGCVHISKQTVSVENHIWNKLFGRPS